MRGKTWFGIGIAAVVVLGPINAGAQPQGARDTVRLRNGGVLHGTIAEEVPGRGIVIVLVTGETRRVPQAEIISAGPDTAPPQVPALLGTVNPARAIVNPVPVVNPAPPLGFVPQAPGAVAVRFESTGPSATLHRVTGTAVATSSVYVAGHYGVGTARANSFERICTGPCAFTAPVGTHELALSIPGRDPVIAEPITLNRGGVLRGTYDSRADIRAVGWTIFIGGLVGSLALLGASVGVADSDGGITNSRTGRSMVYGSLGLLVAAPLLAMPFMFQRDRVEFRLDAE